MTYTIKHAQKLAPGDIIEVEGEDRMVETAYRGAGKIHVKLCEEGERNFGRDHVSFKPDTEVVTY